MMRCGKGEKRIAVMTLRAVSNRQPGRSARMYRIFAFLPGYRRLLCMDRTLSSRQIKKSSAVMMRLEIFLPLFLFCPEEFSKNLFHSLDKYGVGERRSSISPAGHADAGAKNKNPPEEARKSTAARFGRIFILSACWLHILPGRPKKGETPESARITRAVRFPDRTA